MTQTGVWLLWSIVGYTCSVAWICYHGCLQANTPKSYFVCLTKNWIIIFSPEEKLFFCLIILELNSTMHMICTYYFYCPQQGNFTDCLSVIQMIKWVRKLLNPSICRLKCATKKNSHWRILVREKLHFY